MLSVILKEKINGEVSLTFSVPSDHPDSEQIKYGNRIVWHDMDNIPRCFVISEEEESHDSNGLIREFYTEELAVCELNDDIVTDVRPNNTTAKDALDRILANSLWEVGTVDNLGTASTNVYYESAMAGIQKVIESWGGEVRFRVSIADDNTITGRYVDLFERLGSDTGKRFEYSKDLTSVTRTVDMKSVKTALYGRGKGEETDSGGYGRRITFKGVEWSKLDRDPTEKPAGQEYVEDFVAMTRWGHRNPDGTYRHRYGVYVNEEIEDPEELLQETWKQLQEVNDPLITYEMSVVNLEHLYDHEVIRLGDTVRVIDNNFAWDVRVEARVIELERDLLRPENTSVTLGNAVGELGNIVRQIESKIDKKVATGDVVDWLQSELDLAKKRVISATSHLYLGDSQQYPGLFIPNAKESDSPTEAVYLTSGGMLLSDSTLPDGSFNWRTAITGKGINANEINAGTLNAELVNIQSIGTDRSIYLKDGQFKTYYNGKHSLSVGAYSMTIYDHGMYDPNPSYTEAGTVGLMWLSSGSDTGNNSSYRGLGVVTYKDFINLGFAKSDGNGEYTSQPILRVNRASKLSQFYGPASDSKDDYIDMQIFADSRPRSENTQGGIFDAPGIRIHRGIFPNSNPSSYVSGVQVYISDYEDQGVEGSFKVNLIEGESNYNTIFNLDRSHLYIEPTLLQIGPDTCKINVHRNVARWQQSDSNYILQASNGNVAIYAGGQAKHTFYANGTKSGGSIELDGKNWGMSPIDSPRILIEDVIFDQEIKPEGVTITLDERLSKALDGKYDVFPSRGDVIVTDKSANSFVVQGEGIVSLRIIGTRKGTNQYFEDMSIYEDIVEEGNNADTSRTKDQPNKSKANSASSGESTRDHD
ncbi:phage tail protein [Hazenella sp. IB182357]|uniref:Phage tail protein n=1 Tax=Polycladospora coralii TaxID=2771432 RepID=A0A926NBB1_9BACL|nr:phage tail protein [Polycladospora coralii]MBD1373746.1 phage tail protein [Polycladospora coralii]